MKKYDIVIEINGLLTAGQNSVKREIQSWKITEDMIAE